jgi:hypothetical protein
MKEVGNSGKVIGINQIKTCLWSTLNLILKVYKYNNEWGKISAHHARRPRREIKTDVDDFDKCVIRRTMNEFYTTKMSVLL